jgi:hypothetical protein
MNWEYKTSLHTDGDSSDVGYNLLGVILEIAFVGGGSSDHI